MAAETGAYHARCVAARRDAGALNIMSRIIFSRLRTSLLRMVPFRGEAHYNRGMRARGVMI